MPLRARARGSVACSRRSRSGRRAGPWRDAIGKRDALPAHLKVPIRVVEVIDILARKFFRCLVAFQDDLPAVLVEAELRIEVALLAMAQDIGQPRLGQVDLAMQVVRLR